jgi:hypothetical protein
VATPARSRWASAKVSDFAKLFGVFTTGPEALFNVPDDAGNGPEGFKTEGRFLGFFMFIRI